MKIIPFTALRSLTGLFFATLVAAVQAQPAPAVCSGDPNPAVLVPLATGAAGVSPILVGIIGDLVPDAMATAVGNRVSFLDHRSLVGLAGHVRETLLLGSDAVGNNVLEDLGRAAGAGDWTLKIKVTRAGSTRRLHLDLLDKRGRVDARSRQANLPDNDTDVIRFVKAEAAAMARGLDCDLRKTRVTPAQPLLEMVVKPARGQTGDTLTVTVRLVDLAVSIDPGEPDQKIVLEHITPEGITLKPELKTNASGVDNYSLVLGAPSAKPGTLMARFVRSDGQVKTSAPVKYYVVAPGNLNLSADKAQLRPTGTDNLRASLRHAGSGVPSAAVNLSATGGAVGAASVITGSAGTASVSYAAPATPALVDVEATASLPAGAGTATARLSYVVDPGVVMSLQAGGDTVIFGAVSLKVDLERAQQAAAGATVNFSVTGGGTLSVASATTDSVGRAEIAFAAPSRAGASTLTASTTLDGQTYTRNVTVRYSDPLDALTREIADVKEAMWLNPSDATLTRLNTLRGALLARGEASRAESLLADQLVQSPLSCVQERAHRECAAALRSKGEATLGLVKGITNGSARLDWLYSRAKDSLRVCPYPAFMTSTGEGSVFGYATFSDITRPPANWEFFLSISWDQEDRIRGFTFSAADETNRDGLAVNGYAPTGPGDGSLFTGRIQDGNLSGTLGNRFLMLDYQSRATAPTVSVTVNGTTVTANIALYEGFDFQGVMKTATVSFSTTVTLPPAPSMTCTNRSLPTGD